MIIYTEKELSRMIQNDIYCLATSPNTDGRCSSRKEDHTSSTSGTGDLTQVGVFQQEGGTHQLYIWDWEPNSGR